MNLYLFGFEIICRDLSEKVALASSQMKSFQRALRWGRHHRRSRRLCRRRRYCWWGSCWCCPRTLSTGMIYSSLHAVQFFSYFCLMQCTHERIPWPWKETFSTTVWKLTNNSYTSDAGKLECFTETTSRRRPPPTRRCGTRFISFGRRLQSREMGWSEVLKRRVDIALLMIRWATAERIDLNFYWFH